MAHIKLVDIAWLGGLIEGEAWFGFTKRKYPIIRIKMTSEDTIAKVATIWNTRVYHLRNTWQTEVNGVDAIQWMMTLYSFLDKCRKEKITRIIKYWREHDFGRTLHKTMLFMAPCHPNKPYYALNLCHSCHQRQWKKKQLLKKVG